MTETPLMKQYHDFKLKYADQILFFRLGDFYEMFDEDAIEVSSLLNLTLTHKGDSPMCGIPYHAAKNYIRRLLDLGKKVAVCEQLELAESSKSLAKREVVRIITPATVVDEDFLDEKNYNYILCVFQNYCSYCDISTGEFCLKLLDKSSRIQSLREILQQISPKEILVCEDEYFLDSEFKSTIDEFPAIVSKLAPWYFNLKKCFEVICNHFKVKSLVAFGLNDKDKVIIPAGALLKYASENAKTDLKQLNNLYLEKTNNYLSLDESSRKNLELFRNLFDVSSKFSLCETINRCKSSSGYRLLKKWISFPLRDIDQIKFRQSWVKFFYENSSELERVRNAISQSSDMNRLTTRILMKRSVPRDLIGIKNSISSFFDLISVNTERYQTLFKDKFDQDQLASCASLMTEVNNAINDQFLGQFNPGQVILSGYDSHLDELRQLKNHGDEILKDYLEKEKEKNNLTILKLGYNRIFGYYLEIPKGQVSKAPDYFYRKQTLVNGERYTTDELIAYEKEILSASAQAEAYELSIYQELNSKVLNLVDVLNNIGNFLSELDVLQSFATLAIDSNYVCPEVSDEDVLVIEEGRHPVVEKQIGFGGFVSNNLDMSVRFTLITGPNMAGKSTYLRQNALIILLAHIGSFVPAKKAKVGLTDKIFCRVGASDNLARGESTFLLEMQEAAFILRNCTSRSFVIVDEIGRGTSTQDGMSIAYAVMQELIRCRAKTLFATHYHELTMIDNSGIELKTLAVEENRGNIRFLRKVIDGVANSSYGIHVAKMAGIPMNVIKEARTFQSKHFSDYSNQQNELFTNSEITEYIDNNSNYKEIAENLKEIDIEELTPVQALLILSKLKELSAKIEDN